MCLLCVPPRTTASSQSTDSAIRNGQSSIPHDFGTDATASRRQRAKAPVVFRHTPNLPFTPPSLPSTNDVVDGVKA